VARMLQIVLVNRVINHSLRIEFVVSYIHTKFKIVLLHSIGDLMCRNFIEPYDTIESIKNKRDTIVTQNAGSHGQKKKPGSFWKFWM
jgi:hypothetical protein